MVQCSPSIFSSCNKSGVCIPVAWNWRYPRCFAKILPPGIPCQKSDDNFSNSFPVDGNFPGSGGDFIENARLHHVIQDAIWFEFHSDGSKHRTQTEYIFLVNERFLKWNLPDGTITGSDSISSSSIDISSRFLMNFNFAIQCIVNSCIVPRIRSFVADG